MDLRRVLVAHRIVLALLAWIAAATPSVAQTLAGTTAGSLTIDQDGSADYTIPVTVPPGAGGMQPDLTLSYDSQSGAGALGQGFTLSGLGQISRCAATLVQDGFIDPVDFDAVQRDRFCLNGKRLIAVTGAYGAVGTRYRTEMESFSEIISAGGTLGDPGYFIERTKSGLTITYGQNTALSTTTNSRFVPPNSGNKALVWGMDSVQDTASNYMTIVYTQNPTGELGEFRPTRINYTGNLRAARLPTNYVQLDWNYVKDVPTITYIGGATTRQGRHISAITTFSNAVQIRKYTFTYTRNTTNGQNYLTSVTECGTGNQCFPPTTFEWTGATGTAHFNGAGTGTWIAHNAGFTKNRIADRDGNGVMDFVALENEGTASARIRNCLSLGTGFDCSTTNPVPQITNFNLVGDYNGDGVTDYGAIENSVQQFNRFFRITGGATYFETEACFQGGNAGDINGDGISDLLGVYHDCTNNFRQYTAFYGSTTGVFTKAHLGSVPTGLVVGTGDFNGDGKTDNMRFSGTSVTVCLNSGASCFSWGGPTIPSGQAPVLGDFNGDGLTDVAAFQSGTTWSICLSTGKAFAACTGVSINSGGSANNTVADFNGDGIADFAQRTSGSTWNTCLGHGGTKFTCQSRTGPSVANSSTAPVDLNGDGLTDLAGFVAGSNWSVGLASEQKPGLLKAVTNGFGSRTDITYAPLSRISTYVKPANLSASVRGIRVPFYVVTRTERNAVTHTASRRAVSYEYEGARVDVAGRGFLGFASRTIRDEMTGKSETTQYRQDFPYVGLPSSMTVKIAGGSTVTSETSLYGLRTFGTGFSTRYFPYPSSSTSSKYEIPPYARLVSSITTSNAYGDDYGNLTASTITTTADGLSYTTTTVNTYINDTLNWLLGRLTRSEVTRTTPTDGPRTRVSSFDYDTLTGLLSGETVEPDSLTLRLNKTYLRDNFGNITTTTVSGSGITPRVSTDTYSADGRFKLTSTNPLLQTESRTFDSGTGNVLTATDLNNLTTTFQYDGLGRLTLQSFNQAGINKTTTTTRALCSQISLCPVTSDYYAITTSESTGQSATVIYDVAERQTAKIVKSPSGNILTRTEYDTEDQVTRMSSPSLSGPTNLYWTQFTYDDLGRVLQENAPIDRNTPTGRITRFEYDGLTVRKFDALNRKTTTVVDALERVVSVTDALNGQVINTYDAFDNLKTVQDAGGAVTSMDYNIRGHKIAMTDPNMGSWTYGYDALGQLLTQQDAKGQIVTMTYDPLGRMLTRIEPEGTTTWVHDTRWRGALTQVDAPGYSRSYTYYGHGGIEQEVTRILAASPPESTSAAITLTVAENVTSALSTVLNWTTSDATSCTAQGTLPGWSGSVDVNGSQVVGLPAEGLYTATLNCVGTLGKSFSRSLEIRVAPRPVVAFDGFEVDRNSVPAGETVSLSWSARNASACVATGDLPGWEGPQPVYGSVTIPQTSAGVFQAGLSCADESDRLASISKAVEIRCQVPLLSCAEGRGAERERHLDTVDFGFLHRPYAPSVIAVPAQADAPRAKVTVQVAVTINGFVEYVTRFNYDTQGRVSQITYPSGFQVAHTYNTAGALEKVFDPAAPATPYWTGQVWDEWGNVSQSRLRNGVDILRDHDAAVGRLTAIVAGPSSGSAVQSLEYGYDLVDNLTHRLDNNQGGLREDFFYDSLNRLDRSTLTGVVGMPGTIQNLALTYTANGNIGTKTGVGTYTYNPARPHAVSSAGGSTYSYDANGNMLAGASRTMDWTSYNLPSRLGHSNGNFSEWLYGSERQRVRQLSRTGTTNNLIYYPNAIYEEQRRGSTVEQKHFISTPQGVIAVETWWNSGAVRRDYLHSDHLGSVDAITDDAGTVVQRLSFDAFGKRRSSQWQGSPGISGFLVTRGFTGHEMLDGLDLVHMNGRVYDPLLGRFISADPIIQAPQLTQNHNRYSYVMNNPLSLVDPSGYSWFSKILKEIGNWFKDNWRTIVAIAIMVVAPQLGLPMTAGTAMSLGFAAGLIASGGNFKAALLSGITAGVFYGLGPAFNAAAESASGFALVGVETGRAFAYGIVGGMSSAIQGGKFGVGFISAAVPAAMPKLVPPSMQPRTFSGQVVQAAVVGGTASTLGGGKFANGAVTGAFAYTFSRMSRSVVGRGDDGSVSGVGDPNESPQARIDRLAANVYDDYPNLPRDKEFVPVENLPGYRGLWSSQSRILIEYGGRSDADIQATIFHELLHVDEANFVALGNRLLYANHEIWTNFGHDPWITQAGDAYGIHLRIGGPAAPPPALENAPWRR